MAVGLSAKLPPLHPVDGVRIAAAAAGIKHANRNDTVVVDLGAAANCAAVFTRNAFCAAPVVVARRHLAVTRPRYLLINSGNANAGTGEQGVQDALACCASLASLAGCESDEVLPFSTGVIGELLPIPAMQSALPQAFGNLDPEAWHDAAAAIMTTDTVPKGVSRQVSINGATVTITGIAKGSGMICPDMATMLAFVFTDANVEQSLLQHCLEYAMDSSFNCITVDGDTSTNDACVLVATGNSELAPIDDSSSDAYQAFAAAIGEVCEALAQMIVRDGEGATKFITIEVEQGGSVEECRQVAYTVAHSPLVKTAFFAADPNWGRILAALGRAGVTALEIHKVAIYLDEVCIVRAGQRADDYQENQGQAVMQRDEITIRLELGRGDAYARLWTCDLSYDYVRINAEYRT